MITIHLLIQNDLNKIEMTLESIHSLQSKVIVGNLGSTDGTIDLCKKYKCKIIDVELPRYKARNLLVSSAETDWQFYLYPGEVLSSGHDLISNINGIPKRVYIVLDKLITKEVRLWKKSQGKFTNSAIDDLQSNESEAINVFVSGIEQSNYLDDLLKWKKQSPQLKEIDYYLASQYLMLKNYDQFLQYANYFIFKEDKPTYSNIITKYYLAQVQLHVKKNVHESIRSIIYCLAQKPLMAEFWCVLGDCYYRAGVPEKAIEFFKFAIELGKERLTDDSYPIELSKYSEYPLKMIELCKSIVKTTFSP